MSRRRSVEYIYGIYKKKRKPLDESRECLYKIREKLKYFLRQQKGNFPDKLVAE